MKFSFKCEIHLLYPFLTALRKISRAISFEHNAPRESSFFLTTKLFISRKCFYLVHNLFRPLAVFLQESNSPLLGEKFRLTICESFYRLWASWFSWLTPWRFLSVTVDCRELAWSRNTSIKRLSHGWWTQIKETFSSAFISWYVDVSPSRVWKSPRRNWEIMQPIEIGIFNLINVSKSR